MGVTISIILRLRNSTNTDITSLTAYDLNTADFGAIHRPDYILNGQKILSGTCLERMIDINSKATNCPFTVKLNFKDGTIDVFNVNIKSAYDVTEPNLRHLSQSHELILKKPGPRILEIEIKHTEAQQEDQKAEKLNAEGVVLMGIGKFEEASIKFLEALQKANNRKTKDEIRKNLENLRAEKVNSEGLGLMNEMKYVQAVKKFEEALNLARNSNTISKIEQNFKRAKIARDDQEAKMLTQEGLKLRKIQENDVALKKFDEALKIALDPNLISSIKFNKGETLFFEAMKNLESAWLTDGTDDSIHKFAKAKFLLEEADSIKSIPEYKEFIEVINLKVEGSRLFNVGLQLEKEGGKTVCKEATEKYKEAYKKYENAKRKFEEGVRKGEDKFQGSVEMASEACKRTEKVLKVLEEVEESQKREEIY